MISIKEHALKGLSSALIRELEYALDKKSEAFATEVINLLEAVCASPSTTMSSYDEGYKQGQLSINEEAKTDAYDEGYEDGRDMGFANGSGEGYEDGIEEGLRRAREEALKPE